MRMLFLALALVIATAACTGAGSGELPRLAPDEILSPHGEVMKVQNVGLPSGMSASGTPPLGVGLLPSSGRGADGNFQVTQVGGWSSGAGAIKGYAGQWTVPLEVEPTGVIANTTCDFFNPSPTIVVTFELVTGTTVIGSIPVPSSNTVVIRGWLLPVYRVADGEQPLLRISARNATTGAWATSSEQPTVISCAINSSKTRTLPVDGSAFRAITSATAIDAIDGCTFTGGFGVQTPVTIPLGSTVTSARFYVRDSAGTVVQANVRGRDASLATIGSFTGGSAGTGASQILSTARPFVVDPGRGYFIQVVYFSASGTPVVGTGVINVAFAELDYF